MVLLTGNGRAFSAGNDLNEMAARITDPALADQGSHFTSMIDALTEFPKPLICAVNGLGLGIGTTILGYADLVFMSTDGAVEVSVHQPRRRARGRVVVSVAAVDRSAECGVAADVLGVGRRAQEALRMGLAWRVCEPDDLLPEARRHAEILAARPIPSLIAVKQTMTEPAKPGSRRPPNARTPTSRN